MSNSDNTESQKPRITLKFKTSGKSDSSSQTASPAPPPSSPAEPASLPPAPPAPAVQKGPPGEEATAKKPLAVKMKVPAEPPTISASAPSVPDAPAPAVPSPAPAITPVPAAAPTHTEPTVKPPSVPSVARETAPPSVPPPVAPPIIPPAESPSVAGPKKMAIKLSSFGSSRAGGSPAVPAPSQTLPASPTSAGETSVGLVPKAQPSPSVASKPASGPRQFVKKHPEKKKPNVLMVGAIFAGAVILLFAVLMVLAPGKTRSQPSTSSSAVTPTVITGTPTAVPSAVSPGDEPSMARTANVQANTAAETVGFSDAGQFVRSLDIDLLVVDNQQAIVVDQVIYLPNSLLEPDLGIRYAGIKRDTKEAIFQDGQGRIYLKAF